MDKETLSNYGWVVICVLVLVVMIALATPFGSFISQAVQSTTKGLFDVNKSALDNTGLITIDDQEFDVPDMNHGAENNVKLITFKIGVIDYQAEEGMTWEDWVGSKYSVPEFEITDAGYLVAVDEYGLEDDIGDGNKHVKADDVIIENHTYGAWLYDLS
jgi:hypothetical protein